MERESSELLKCAAQYEDCWEKSSYETLEKDFEISKLKSELTALKTKNALQDTEIDDLKSKSVKKDETIDRSERRVSFMAAQKASAESNLVSLRHTVTTLQQKLLENIQENMQVITKTAAQIVDRQARIQRLEYEKTTSMVEFASKICELEKHNRRLRNYSDSLDRTDRNLMAQEAARNKAEADYCYRQMMRLRSVAEDNAAMPSDYPKMVEELQKRYTSLELQRNSQVFELKDVLHQSQTTREEQHVNILSLADKVEDVVRKNNLLQNQVTRYATYHGELSGLLNDQPTDDNVDCSTKLHAQFRAETVDRFIIALETDDKIKTRQAIKIEEQTKVLGEKFALVATLEADVQRLEIEIGQGSVELMNVEINHEVLKKRAKKAVAAKQCVIESLQQEMASLEAAFDVIGQYSQDEQIAYRSRPEEFSHRVARVSAQRG